MSGHARAKMRLDVVDPVSFADHASRILLASWKPTCLHYPADYLRWEFGFPGNTPSQGAALMLGDEPVGFATLLPRTFRLNGVRTDVHLMSFGAVLPNVRGPYSVALYQTLLAAVKKSGIPVIAFAQVGTLAEQMLVKNLEVAGLTTKTFGHYASYGSPITSAKPPTFTVTVEAAKDDNEVRSIIDRCLDSNVLYSDPDARELAHYRNDPRGRAILVVRAENGEPVGAAMVIRSELVTPTGIQTVAMLDSLFLPEPSTEVLKALVYATGQHWADKVSSPIVTAPNVWGINAAILRSAGLRAISSGFNGYLACANPDHPGLLAEGMNREIV